MLLYEMFRVPSWFMAGLLEFDFGWNDVFTFRLGPWLLARCDLVEWRNVLVSCAPPTRSLREVAVVAKWWRGDWRRQLKQT